MHVTSSRSTPSAVRTAPDVLAMAGALHEWLATAERLRAARRNGTAGRLLMGKNLAVLQPAGATDKSTLHRAATDLGVRAAQLSLGEPLPAAVDLAQVARMLGRLYDAIDASRLPQDAAAELGKHASVPVYRDFGGDGNTLPPLATQLCTQASDGDAMRFLMQALLLRTMA